MLQVCLMKQSKINHICVDNNFKYSKAPKHNFSLFGIFLVSIQTLARSFIIRCNRCVGSTTRVGHLRYNYLQILPSSGSIRESALSGMWVLRVLVMIMHHKIINLIVCFSSVNRIYCKTSNALISAICVCSVSI